MGCMRGIFLSFFIYLYLFYLLKVTIYISLSLFLSSSPSLPLPTLEDSFFCVCCFAGGCCCCCGVMCVYCIPPPCLQCNRQINRQTDCQKEANRQLHKHTMREKTKTRKGKDMGWDERARKSGGENVKRRLEKRRWDSEWKRGWWGDQMDK